MIQPPQQVWNDMGAAEAEDARQQQIMEQQALSLAETKKRRKE